MELTESQMMELRRKEAEDLRKLVELLQEKVDVLNESLSQTQRNVVNHEDRIITEKFNTAKDALAYRARRREQERLERKRMIKMDSDESLISWHRMAPKVLAKAPAWIAPYLTPELFPDPSEQPKIQNCCRKTLIDESVPRIDAKQKPIQPLVYKPSLLVSPSYQKLKYTRPTQQTTVPPRKAKRLFRSRTKNAKNKKN